MPPRPRSSSAGQPPGGAAGQPSGGGADPPPSGGPVQPPGGNDGHRPSSSGGRRPRPKRGLLDWLKILVALTLFAGATACLVQNIQCTCKRRIKCTDTPRSQRKWPCCTLGAFLDFVRSIRQPCEGIDRDRIKNPCIPCEPTPAPVPVPEPEPAPVPEPDPC